MQRIISGIQQIGIGVSDAVAAYAWYKTWFGFNVIVFEDAAPATLMTRYTGNAVHRRYAVLAMNMQGGAGFEIWQYTSRQPVAPQAPLQLGDTGIFAVKIRCRDVEEAWQAYQKGGLDLLTPVTRAPSGKKHFYLRDPFGNVFEVTEDGYWFRKSKSLTGGVCGTVIGVRDMDRALSFYRTVLGYDVRSWEGEGVFEDLAGIEGGKKRLRRVLLQHKVPVCGPFSRLLGPSTLELVQVQEGCPQKIFEGRYWGDLGFIHICYDLCGLDAHAQICAGAGQPLTVNSGNSFDMGNAAGQFAYNEDPDGTLIEYVETHKVPILKKWGWHLDLRNRSRTRPLPDWMIRCMGLGKKGLQLPI